MTVSVSLKLENQTFVEINEIVKGTNISRNKYINEALKYYNKLKKREAIIIQLKLEIERTSESSLEVLKDYETLLDDYETV
ncbi:MAG: hypothetical protein KA109_10645 [Saprospiraceae bacterium]|jgi:hypothetical protein|nr:hypothetical protein [Saprospiraceae bacterium]MBK6478811.1 hypothetical protein [Saprospiraceae bacterium]MBK6816788.1 hypothetical protein [Saprospiraceae bacterium]MBK7371316.1 hypothetical protein [Saprospiraceae bacterium]MBK7436190.1 hypothetical protein [Saprospiraceae bacterium]